MKRLLIIATLFAACCTFATAQNTTAPKKAKTTINKKSGKKTKAVKATTAPATMTTAPAAAKVTGPAATFKSTEMDYGRIKQGAEPLRVFEFTNTGSEPLIISGAQGSCGCTVPTYPKEPIMPGQSSKIEVRYDTQRIGGFTKTVTLTTNEANATRILTIKGEVEAPAAGGVTTQTPTH